MLHFASSGLLLYGLVSPVLIGIVSAFLTLPLQVPKPIIALPPSFIVAFRHQLAQVGLPLISIADKRWHRPS